MLKNACFLFWFLYGSLSAQKFNLSGIVRDNQGKPLEDVLVSLLNQNTYTYSNVSGGFNLEKLTEGEYLLKFSLVGMKDTLLSYVYNKTTLPLQIILYPDNTILNEIEVKAKSSQELGRRVLRSIEGTSIYESKKSEVVILKDITANVSTNNPRQVFAKITGLNIWESDGAGLQLGIGGRGLSPNRTANFNTRQNGYDIAADALGYPESYYTPPVEALEKIEVVRGASSLQYGTQFGGMLNFVFKNGPAEKKFEITSRQTAGSWNFFGSFNSIGGKVGNVQYYSFYQKKKGNGWRPNSQFNQDNAYLNLTWSIRPNIRATFNYTFSAYTAQQAGGLTDAVLAASPRTSSRERNWFDVNWNLASLDLTWDINNFTSLNSRTFGLNASRYAIGNLERITVADLGGLRTLIIGEFKNIGNETRLLKKYVLGKTFGAFVLGTRVYSGNTSAVQGDASNGSGPDFTLLNPEYPEKSSYLFPSTNIAFFAENVFHFTDKWSLTPGIRWENIRTGSEGYFRQRVFDFAGNLLFDKKNEESSVNTRSFFIAGIGGSFRPTESMELYANISQNYRAINFSDLRIVNPNFSVDPDIEDERGFSADIGFRGNASNWLNFDISLFQIFYKGRIGQVLRSDLPPLFLDYRFRTNVADARSLGVEAFWELDFLKLVKPKSKTSFSWFLNSAIVRARYINSAESGIQGNYVEMVPPFLVRSGIQYKSNVWRASFQWSYVAQHFTDASNALRTSTAVEGIVPAYQIADISAIYLWKKFSLEGSINNLFNAVYFTRRAEGYPGPGIIPADGRGFYCTLQVRI